jgi:hypothetical protein
MARRRLFEVDIWRNHCLHQRIYALQRDFRVVRSLVTFPVFDLDTDILFPLPSRRIFTAPGDGRSFKWSLGISHSTVSVGNAFTRRVSLIIATPQLELNDGSKTPAARSHRSNRGFIGKARQARLEIFPGFEHLVDIFLITYVYVEKLRKERELFILFSS